ncbi:chromo domain-containing protein 1 [Podospora aff. communis PSN243]|uniref:Chromo domain-containing protein 1 n=1 Tax=Podospora aff. communis PSN243 TaxID=3040156 RepID=A0AAV9H8Z5_9PEZI|nr:chromo domain-containing protein 1 [Podospora aff. communis PSN243]
MFTNLKRKHPSEAAAESDDDAISLTSTVDVPADPDQEFEVEDIMGEEANQQDGRVHLLVKWAGFGLHECSWEPLENINDELMETWEEKKRNTSVAELKSQRAAIEAAQEKAELDKADRHRRRNAKRKRKGLPLTPPFPEPESSSSESEASEDEFIADNVPDAAAKARSQRKQKPASPAKASTSATKTTATPSQAAVPKAQAQPQNQPRRTSVTKTAAKADAAPPNKPAASASSTRAPIERPSATGYQGTARKLSDKPNPSNVKGVTAPIGGRPINKPAPGKMTAKKAGNIFITGQTRKQRGSFRDILVDPSKAPAGSSKQYNLWSTRRKAQLASRAKEDLAPDADALYLFDPSTAGKRTSSLNSNKETPQASPTTVLSPQAQAASPTELWPASEPQTLTEPTALTEPKVVSESRPPGGLKNQNSTGGPSVKRKKSVRFAGDDDQPLSPATDDPMDIDSGRTRLRSPPQHEPIVRSPSPIQSPLTQTPLVQFGAIQSSPAKGLALHGKRLTAVVFDGLPADPTLEWVRHFMVLPDLNFKLSCLAQTAQAQLKGLIHAPLAAGTINPSVNGSDVEKLAEFLKASLLGLFLPHTHFNLLVYPAKCEEWKFEGLGQGPENSSALRYFIFSSLVDCARTLAPLPKTLSIPSGSLGGSDKKPPPETTTRVVSPRELVFKRFFNFEYRRLLPPAARRKPGLPDVFFLVFPESKAHAMAALYSWLRECNPNCQIFLSCQPGAWKAFRAVVDSQPGVVIVHDILTPTFRRFPNIGRYLVEKQDEYWCFAEPHRPQAFPYTTLVDDTSPLSQIQLSRIFSLRTAILITPSFMVSQPQELHKLLQWFETKDKRGFNYRLVTAWNFHEYLSELAIEKERARVALFDSDATPVEIINLNADLRGLGSEDCDMRRSTAKAAVDLHIQRLDKTSLLDGEENSRLVYADQCIDPNDEQSLVNWFGWWASLRTDQFRKFYVVGSGDLLKFQPRRGERTIRIPKYSRHTINDPDAVLETCQQLMRESVEAEDTQPSLQVPTRGGGNLEANQAGPPPFQSDLIALDDSRSLEMAIKECISQVHKDLRWQMYNYPVAWDSLDTADHFGDYNAASFKRFQDWLQYPWEFQCSKASKFNTYVGFFYTVTVDCSPENLPNVPKEIRQVPRHPWIGIYRVAFPPVRPPRHCELIIWDAHARQRCPGAGQPFYDDLLYMQRRWIDHVQQRGPVQNPGTKIRKVWLGGFDISHELESPNAMDATLRKLPQLLSDLKNQLPLPAKVLVQRGFREVQLQGGSPRRHSMSSHQADDTAESVEMDIDPPSEDEAEDDEDTRIIFHPPRGTKMVLGQRTKCTNRLYEEARLARARRGGRDPETMEFQFIPTAKWYKDQVDEGRGFEFINVEPWQDICRDLQIDKQPNPTHQTTKAVSEEATSGGEHKGPAASA